MNRILSALVVIGLLLPFAPRVQAADPSPTPPPKIKSKTEVEKRRRIVEGYSAEFYAGGRIENEKPKGVGPKKVQTSSAPKSSDPTRTGPSALVNGMYMDAPSAQKRKASERSTLRTEGNAPVAPSPSPTPKPKRAPRN